MIALLEGKIEFKGQKFVVVNVSGVGYKIFAAAETLNKLPEKNQAVKLWTHQYVRENALELYGFFSFAELDMFETLIGISGIGPRGALGVLSIAPIDTLKKAIASGDTSYLTRVSGIGRKTAEKIVLELKDKMSGSSDVSAPELKEEADALDALVSLGYSKGEAKEALRDISKDALSAEEKVRSVLKRLGKSK